MARPVNADASATRARILEAAQNRFGAEGPGSVSVRDVAAHAGVSLATVHHYFGTKDRLYQASVEAMYEELQGLLENLDPSTIEGEDRATTLATLVSGAFVFARQHRETLRLLMRSVLDQGELSEPLRERFQLPTLLQGAALLHRLTGVSALKARLSLQSLVHVVLRYALSSDRELEALTGAKGEEARSIIVAHLTELALSALDAGETP
jgi:AcrR family transcriptional regulator